MLRSFGHNKSIFFRAIQSYNGDCSCLTSSSSQLLEVGKGNYAIPMPEVDIKIFNLITHFIVLRQVVRVDPNPLADPANSPAPSHAVPPRGCIHHATSRRSGRVSSTPCLVLGGLHWRRRRARWWWLKNFNRIIKAQAIKCPTNRPLGNGSWYKISTRNLYSSLYNLWQSVIGSSQETNMLRIF